eukprot:TRINITY_DN5483_c0_g1_i1.p1 TRINITY_DN5483_c0_g1~~TRINITY_DN5483_c0_g1_i1.p1  ORF type:complete len:191 (-),score=40.56 TRINITY_DN5483_c0_g1_i1:62-634(-)
MATAVRQDHSSSSSSSFSFPSFYNFPPFYTLQPVNTTRSKQLELWSDLIVRYMSHHRQFELDLSSSHCLFDNSSINRKLSLKDIRVVIDHLVEHGNAEWVNEKDKKKVSIFWKRLDEFATILYQWVNKNGLTDSVVTVWELCNGDDHRHNEWYGLSTNIMIKVIKVLQDLGKAEMFEGSTSDGFGVKFFS